MTNYDKKLALAEKEYQWQQIMQQTNDEIFESYDINSLSDREKRKIIFDYLVANSTYDYDLLRIIRTHQPRNSEKELEIYAQTKHSVCNAIAEFYKMILSYNNIYSICVVCVQESQDMPSGLHMLNLVYDDKSDGFSFDDITMTIIERDHIKEKYGELVDFDHDKYFNYDLETANQYGQGNEKPYNFTKSNYYLVNFGLMWPFFEKTSQEEYKKYGLEEPYKTDIELPENIRCFDEQFINKK